MTKNPTNPENEKMLNEDYLWDVSGTPDPEIQRLESLLADFRHANRALVLPAELPTAPRKFRGSRSCGTHPRLRTTWAGRRSGFGKHLAHAGSGTAA